MTPISMVRLTPGSMLAAVLDQLTRNLFCNVFHTPIQWHKKYQKFAQISLKFCPFSPKFRSPESFKNRIGNRNRNRSKKKSDSIPIRF